MEQVQVVKQLCGASGGSKWDQDGREQTDLVKGLYMAVQIVLRNRG